MISAEIQETHGELSLNITLEIGLAVSYKTKHKPLMPISIPTYWAMRMKTYVNKKTYKSHSSLISNSDNKSAQNIHQENM